MDFGLELLQAVSDWQRGGDAEQKHRRGEALRRAASTLDPRFRACGLVVYRQISLEKGGVWALLADRKLPETLSGWTLALEIAKTFKGGVPPEGWQGVIVAAAPSPENVVVNLDTLYRDPAFSEAIARRRSEIAGYEAGAGRYAGMQSEVVMELEHVVPDDIHAMGGYSSDRDTLIRMMFGCEPTPELVLWFETNRQRAGVGLGPVWLEGAALRRVIRRMQPGIEQLRAIKAAQLAAGTGQNG